MSVDNRVRIAATELRDSKLLAKLAEGDMRAIDAVYHKHCMTTLYNRYRCHIAIPVERTQKDSLDSIALAELISYIEERRKDSSESITYFKLSDLARLYKNRLVQLGSFVPDRINTTHLKKFNTTSFSV